jgi:tetratricopeptide (TPR) repeat protein
MKSFMIVLLLLLNSYLFAQDIHTPTEIILMMTNSSTKYKVDYLKDKINCEDYSSKLNTNDYYRVEDNGNISIYKYKLKQKAAQYFDIAETFFSKEKLDSALVYYKKAYDEDTSAYQALTYIGQCNGLLLNNDVAVKYYKMAIDKNYIDYMAHWFLCDIYCVEGNYEDAAKEITIAQVLNRNNPRIQKKLADVYKRARIKWNDFCFNPQVKIVDLGGADSVSLAFDEIWMMYAFTKAAWGYEKGYRESMGQKKTEYSVLEEIESLVVLFTSLKKADKNYNNIPELVALEKAINAKMLNSYIYYEIMLVKYPISAYLFPREDLDRTVDYVMKVRAGNN